MAILIERADYVVRDADRIERDADVLIVGERIAAVGHALRSDAPDAQTIDGRGRVVIPGLINAHVHLYQSFLKGLRDDVGLVEWCDATLYPMAHAIHTEYREQGDETCGYHWAMLSALEMIRGGVTTCVDMNMNMDSVFRAWLQVGIRGVGAVALSDRWIPAVLRRDPETTRAEALRLVTSWHNQHSRIQVVLAPSTPFLCSRAMLEWARDRAAEIGIGVQIHLAETRYEVESVLKETGLTPVAYAHGLGLLNRKNTAVHCVHVTDAEIDLLAETGANVVHCPKSNLKLGSGIAPIPKMLARGVSVALATDGAASNDTLDMFEETRMAALLHKGIAEDPTPMTARQAFRLATEGGARAVGIDAGTLEPGKLADLAIVNLNRPHLMPMHDVVNTLVYCAKASDVETTIIGGEIVMRDGFILTVDEEATMREAARYGSAMYARGVKMWSEVKSFASANHANLRE
jgi:5-methylthioadenosine/S-adenosylhomocysteine deaminase